MGKKLRKKIGMPKPSDELLTFKVRCARTFAAYFFVEARNQEEAESIASKDFEKKDAESEASHIHDTFEVEEVAKL